MGEKNENEEKKDKPGKEKQQVKFKEIMSQDKVIQYLSDLIDSIKAGTVTVKNSETAMTLKPSAMVELEVKAVIKPNKHKLDLEIEWIPGSGSGEAPSFTISAEEGGGDDT